MNAEQKKIALECIRLWGSEDLSDCAGDQMAALLQELVDAHEPKPVARVTGYYAGYLSIATVDGRVLPAGTALYAAPPHQSEHHLEMVNTPAEATADVARDSVASEPVGYLYTNLQSGEYHVSDADDDYRGPERVLWCIEPVYRRAKGQS